MGNTRSATQIEGILHKGELLADKYRVVSSLGTGNFAYVLKGRHEIMGRDVALKILKPDVIRQNPEVSERFLTEVRIVSRLKCPNTVTVFDFGETDAGLLYMVLEYVDGTALDQVLAAEGALDAERAVKLTLQILKSLDEAHALGVVHRDLKPGNIMLTETRDKPEFVKVLDFGVAKLMSEEDDAPEPRSASGLVRRSTQFIGTPIYMSPEQVLGRKVTPAADIYSLGLILYEMLAGESPIDSSLNVAAVAQQHIDYKPLPFKRLKDIPPNLRAAILKATTRKPEERFKDAREFARAIRADSTGDFLSHRTKSDKRPKSDKRAKPQPKPNDVDPSSPFSGNNYVDIPESEAEEVPGLLPAKKPTPQKKQAPSPTVKRPKSELGISGELQVDIGKVRREELARKRKQREELVKHVEKPHSRGPEIAWISGGFVAFFVSFFLSSVLVEASVGVRAAMGFAPLGLAVLLAGFSSVRRSYGSVYRRWLIPVCKELVYVTGGSLVLISLTIPSAAATDISNFSDWFVDGIPGVGLALKPVGLLIYTGLEAWFVFISGILPW